MMKLCCIVLGSASFGNEVVLYCLMVSSLSGNNKYKTFEIYNNLFTIN